MNKYLKWLLPLLLAVLVLSLVGCTESQLSTVPATTQFISESLPQPNVPSQPVSAGDLQVHFIDVGQADAALVECDGHYMLIDGGNVEDSSIMYTYLKKNGITHLDYVIGTHAHEDHIGGLAGALNYATVDTVYCPTTEYDSEAFRNFVKAANNRGAEITVPDQEMTFSLGGASAAILAVNAAEDTNNTSIVLRLVYGSTSFLFMADAEHPVEQMLVDRYGDSLASTVLKVGHHGSSTSTSYGFLWHVMPQYAVISVGEGNTYGHPEDAVLSRLEDAQIPIYRTDWQGDIIASSDGKRVSFTVSRNDDVAPAEPTQGSQFSYILNTNSHKFHDPHCGAVEDMNPKNKREYTGTREELIEQGYDPCGLCKP